VNCCVGVMWLCDFSSWDVWYDNQHKTIFKLIFLYVFSPYTFGQQMEHKIFWTQLYQVFSKFILSFCTNINFVSLRLLPSIWTSQHFHSIYYLSLLCNSVLHSVHKTCTHTSFCQHLLLTSLLTNDCWSLCDFFL